MIVYKVKKYNAMNIL